MNSTKRITISTPLPPKSAPVSVSDPVPEYLDEVYNWAYLNERNVHFLDRNSVYNILLFGNGKRLARAYVDQIQTGSRVWQAAHVYGDLVKSAAAKVGTSGQFHLTDVASIQIRHARQKIAHLPQVEIFHSDASQWAGTDYDLACSFFLLHEVPDDAKRAIVNQMLRSVAANGRLVFVDYHRPAAWHPVGWILRWVNAKLEPFAYALWNNEIQSYADSDLAHQFIWRKRTMFGGVYQVVSVERKP